MGDFDWFSLLMVLVFFFFCSWFRSDSGCKNAGNVSAADFFYEGFAKTGMTNTTMELWCRLQMLNPPHTHPRATEIVFVLEGQLDVDFITTANMLVSKTFKKSDIFVFPRGLDHFHKNNANIFFVRIEISKNRGRFVDRNSKELD
ncbi:hypothetical protein NE237_017789 [Protea cynaroides]|uniref:Germin-like protein n=1 Tax=Protea cynaroides TaxID=273540 RepID=A0A9Q0QND2_9MAGN|nr:hypothetical protein NE237_017789 [Protea cynaroides]